MKRLGHAVSAQERERERSRLTCLLRLVSGAVGSDTSVWPLSACLSLSVFVCLSVSVSFSVFLSAYLSRSVCLSVSLLLLLFLLQLLLLLLLTFCMCVQTGNMSDIKLVYFDIRGRGEVARLVMVAAGQQWDDARLTFQQWPAEKPSECVTGDSMPEA